MSPQASHPTSIRVIRGDKNSPLHELLSISEERKTEIEELIYCQTTGDEKKTTFEVLSSIKEAIQTQREFAYAMYFWGTCDTYTPKGAGDDEDILDNDNIDIDNPLAI